MINERLMGMSTSLTYLQKLISQRNNRGKERGSLVYMHSDFREALHMRVLLTVSSAHELLRALELLSAA